MKKTMLVAICLLAAAQSASAAYRPKAQPPVKFDCAKKAAKQAASRLQVYFTEYRLLESELGV